MDFEAIKALVRDDLAAVDQEIRDRLRSDVALINELSAYLIGAGGKRLRPLLVLLASHALAYRGGHHVTLAAIVEFIHTATLLHDDVVDDSDLRRGRRTANAVWGNPASVLVGDFLYSRAFEMMVSVQNMRVMEILAQTTNTIARGEILQLINCHDPDTTEDRYLDVIRSKTAKLFEASARLGAVLTGQNREIEDALGRYGMHLGAAFQLIDDVLDYGRHNPELGKNVGDDLAEGKPTLPLIHALKHGTHDQQTLLRAVITEGGGERIDSVVDIIESTGSIAYTARRAEDEATRAADALTAIPASPYRQALADLARFSVHRNH
ncbi:MAG: octaprenyl diphosphate synthase [Pseudomonadota bacterium]